MQTVLCVEWLLLKCRHSTFYRIETIFFLQLSSRSAHPFHPLLPRPLPLPNFTNSLLHISHSLSLFFSQCEYIVVCTPWLLLFLQLLTSLKSSLLLPSLLDVLSNKICIPALNACTAHVSPWLCIKVNYFSHPTRYTSPFHKRDEKNTTENSLLSYLIFVHPVHGYNQTSRTILTIRWFRHFDVHSFPVEEPM